MPVFVEEETVKKELVKKFPSLENTTSIHRTRRIFAYVESSQIRDVISYAALTLRFSILCAITGLDEGEQMAAIYHLARKDGVMLNLKINIPKANPVIGTVTDLFPPADAYERELVDLFGVHVNGLPDGKRYPLPDDWPKGQYPLRKDWKMGNDKKEIAKNEQA